MIITVYISPSFLLGPSKFSIGYIYRYMVRDGCAWMCVCVCVCETVLHSKNDCSVILVAWQGFIFWMINFKLWWYVDSDQTIRYMLFQMSYTSDNVVEGKRVAKEALQKRLGLSTSERPLVGIISRLTHQKGIHLIKHAIWKTLERNGQVIFSSVSVEFILICASLDAV